MSDTAASDDDFAAEVASVARAGWAREETAATHEHEWSDWVDGSNGARYHYCLDSACDEGEIR